MLSDDDGHRQAARATKLRVVNEICCGAPHDEPHVQWGDPGRPIDELLDIVRRQDARLRIGTTGELEREWNAHPPGSPVLRIESGAATGEFVVVDLPSP